MDEGNRLDAYEAYRKKMNARIGEIEHLGIKRFFNLDTAAYRDGALDGPTKELLGLVASAVLRCNDCIDYHLLQCVEAGYSDEELYDALNVGVGRGRQHRDPAPAARGGDDRPGAGALAGPQLQGEQYVGADCVGA